MNDIAPVHELDLIKSQIGVHLDTWYRLVGSSHFKKVEVYMTSRAYAVKVTLGSRVVRDGSDGLRPKSSITDSLTYYKKAEQVLEAVENATEHFHVPLNGVKY
jgi:hypothetical protein